MYTVYLPLRLWVMFQCHEMALSSHEEIVKVLSELQNVSLPLLLYSVNFILLLRYHIA